MFSPQNERTPKSRMKFVNDTDHQNDHSNDQLNDHSPNNKSTQNGTPNSEISDLASDLNSRTNSLLDYAASSGQSSNKMSRAMQKAQDYKARVVEFFMNGDPFKPQFRVTIMRNRDFLTFNKLLDHLTERTKLPIKFVFDAEGKRLSSVDELEHSNIYICSSTNKFYHAQYGSKALKSNFRTSNFSDIRPFLRPLSSKNKYNNIRPHFNNSTSTNSYNSSDSSLENKSMNGLVKKAVVANKNFDNEENSHSDTSRKSDKSLGGRFIKGKVVTIINRKVPVKSSRVLLNLRSARTFEHVVKDLGESVSLPMARILLTPFGNEVRSISQLRRSLNEIDTFFVDDLQLETIEDWNKRNSNKSNSDSLEEGSKSETSKEMNENKDELIERVERLSVAANSSEDLNKKDNSKKRLNLDKGNSTTNSNSKLDLNNNSIADRADAISPKSARKKSINQINKTNLNSMTNNSNLNANNLSKHLPDDLRNEKRNVENAKETPEVYDSNRLSPNEANNQFTEPGSPLPVSPSINEPTELLNNKTSKSVNERSDQVSQSNDLKDFKNNPQTNQFNNNEMNLSNQNAYLNFSNQQNQSQANHLPSNSSKNHLSARHSSTANQVNESSINKSLTFYEAQLVNGVKVPEKKMKLKKIFGYNGDVIKNNLFVLSTGEIAYHVGIFVVCWDHHQNVQRHYFEHTEDICCMDVDHKNQLIVSVQKGNEQENKNIPPILKVWNYTSLETLFSFQNFDSSSANILSVVFSKSSFLLILVLLNNNIQLYYFDWRNNQVISKVHKLLKNEEVYGVIFHPTSDDHFISFGKRHLVQWSLENNELIFKKTFKHILKGNGSSLTCLTFIEGGYLLATDSEGQIYVWSPVANEICEFESTVNEIKAHDSSISCILAFPNRFVVTGDISGVLKTWSFENGQFSLLNVATLPALSGAILSLSFANEILSKDPNYFLENVDNEKLYRIYIGTSTNMIFSGSALQATQYIILYEGHSFGIRAVAVDPVEKYFYTSGIDHKICKWSKNLLHWCVRCKYQCTSMAVYPSGESLAVGCSNGIICILSTTSSQFITQISLSNSAIGCLAYSPDNLLLAAGTENGVLHILPVFDNGSSYDRISAFKCNYPILSLQWSLDCKYILTSINDNDFQEILLWDLNSSNFVKGVSSMNEQISWYDATCFSQETICVWKNVKLENVVNLCCHCSSDGDLVVTGDENGHVRLFQYPCVEQNASFYVAKQSSNAVTEVRFLKQNNCIVSSSFEGSLFIWDLI